MRCALNSTFFVRLWRSLHAASSVAAFARRCETSAVVHAARRAILSLQVSADVVFTDAVPLAQAGFFRQLARHVLKVSARQSLPPPLFLVPKLLISSLFCVGILVLKQCVCWLGCAMRLARR